MDKLFKTIIFTIIVNPKSEKEEIHIFKEKQNADKFSQELKKNNTQFEYYITKYKN